jgi:hypothetical protein
MERVWGIAGIKFYGIEQPHLYQEASQTPKAALELLKLL